MSDNIELSYKIRDYGNLDEFVYESEYLQFGMGTFWTFMGELNFKVNDADFSIENIAIFQFIMNLTSSLNALTIETKPISYPVDYIGTSLSLNLRLEGDSVILTSHFGSDQVSEAKCSFIKLLQKSNETLYFLIKELYRLRPDFEAFKTGGDIQTIINYHKTKEQNMLPRKRSGNKKGTIVVQADEGLSKKDIEEIIKAVNEGRKIATSGNE